MLLLRVAVAIIATAVVMVLPSGLGSTSTVHRNSLRVRLDCGYGWPLTPFNEPHPIRGNLDDPRISEGRKVLVQGGVSGHFHHGVDISAPDGTPVYAVGPGRVRFIDRTALAIRQDAKLMFEYWHILPAVRANELVSRHQLIGWVAPGWGHVHFSEWRKPPGDYVNPRRPGGLCPDPDTQAPVIEDVAATREGVETRLSDKAITSLRGTVDLWASVYDLPAIAPFPPWEQARLSPTLLRWWLKTPEGEMVLPPQTVVDFRRFIRGPLEQYYAWGTEMNQRGKSGKYNFWLARGLDLEMIPPGIYILVVEAKDQAGNAARRGFPVEVTEPS